MIIFLIHRQPAMAETWTAVQVFSFFHMYLPDEVMREVEEKLLPPCIWTDEEKLDHDELVQWALEIIDRQLEGKSFK